MVVVNNYAVLCGAGGWVNKDFLLHLFEIPTKITLLTEKHITESWKVKLGVYR